MIVAVGLNGIIGNSATNNIPWDIKEDMRHFRNMTSGKTVVMGTNTYNSIGKPLPKRKNILITSKPAPYSLIDGLHCCASLPEAIDTNEDVILIGGQGIYKEGMDLGPDTLYVTIVNTIPRGDISFPVTGIELTKALFRYKESIYVCSNRSEWLTQEATDKQDAIEYQFVEFHIGDTSKLGPLNKLLPGRYGI
jgi:dihydrofolate reductase